MSEAWIALIGTVFGGAGLKIIEQILGRKGRKEDFATAIRSELRTEVTSLRHEADQLRDEADELRHELDLWRRKYYSLVSSITTGDLKDALRKITDNKE
jgi:signal transduction histidine kinase